MSSVVETIQGRRTVPLFDPEKSVPQAVIERAIKAATWAPNHHLTEPWRFYQLGEQSTSAYLDLLYVVINEYKDAQLAQKKFEKGKTVPGWLVVTCRNSAETKLEVTEDYAAVCCAIQNLALVLWEEGIGMKWSTGIITRDQRLYEVLGIDSNQETIVALIPFGYPKMVPEPRKRMPLEKVLTILS